MPLRPCLDCKKPTEGNRCASCQESRPRAPRTDTDRARDRERDQVRGTARQRGYDTEHEKRRQELAPDVEAGRAYCAELICLEPSRWIAPGSDWDLAHNREVPGTYLGPAHARCNRAEGARFKARVAKNLARRGSDPRGYP